MKQTEKPLGVIKSVALKKFGDKYDWGKENA